MTKMGIRVRGSAHVQRGYLGGFTKWGEECEQTTVDQMRGGEERDGRGEKGGRGVREMR